MEMFLISKSVETFATGGLAGDFTEPSMFRIFVELKYSITVLKGRYCILIF